MSSVTSLREALAASLESIPDVNVNAYLSASPTLPAIQILPGPSPAITYDQTMGRGHDDVTFTIQAIVSLTSDIGSQKLLDRFMENVAPYSIKHAVELDGTLGGLCDDLSVTEVSGVQQVVKPDGGAMLLAEWTVLALVSGTS